MANQLTVKLDTKCCPSRFMKFISDLNLEDVHMSAIGETPFKHFTNMPANLKCQRTFLSTIITRWNNEKSAFQLGGKLLPILPQDVALIMGLSMNGERIHLEKRPEPEECGLLEKYLKNNEVGMETLERHLKAISMKLSSNKKKSIDKKKLDLLDDFKKLYMLYVCSTILFPNSCRSFPSNIIFMVDKLEKVNNYAWALAVHEFLIKSIRKSSNKASGFINGCVMLLEPWFYEHVSQFVPIHANSYPRYMRWAMGSKYMQKASFKAILDNLSYTEVIEEIIPTQEEMTLLSPPKVSQETTAMAEFIVKSMEERLPSIIGDRESYKTHIKDLEERVSKLEEENERLRSENMELRSRGISEPQSPVDNVDASLHRMDDPSSPTPSMPVCVDTGITAKDIFKKNGGRVRKPSHMLRTPYDACTKATLQRTTRKQASYKRQRLVVSDEDESNIVFSREEVDTIASFEATVGKDADEVGPLKIWRSEIESLLDDEGWISDKVIDSYAKLISGRKPTGKPKSLKCYFFTSWLNTALHSLDETQIKKHLNVKNLKSILTSWDRIFIPMNWASKHWLLLVLDANKKLFSIYNPLRSCADIAYVNETVASLKEQFKQRKILKWENADVHFVDDCPQQDNGNDCGVFVMKFMDCLSRGDTFDFEPYEIQYYRKKLAAQLLLGRGLDDKQVS